MKKILFLLVVTVSLVSCSTFGFLNPEKQAQYLELGMNKQQAIKIMGNDYVVESATKTPAGNLEVLEFRSASSATKYYLYFLNGQLTEYHRYIPSSRNEIHVIKEE